MHPKKSKEFIEEVALSLDIKPEDGKIIIDEYYQQIRAHLSNLDYIRVHLTNLGDFVVKHWKLDDEIQRYERFSQMTGLKPGHSFSNLNKLQLLRALKEEYLMETQRKEFITHHKLKQDETKSNPSLEEERKDSGRSSQLNISSGTHRTDSSSKTGDL